MRLATTGSATVRADLSFATAAQWAAENPVLLNHERAVNTTDGTEKIGDGASTWASLPLAQSATYVSGAGAQTFNDGGAQARANIGVDPAGTALAMAYYFGS